MIARLVIASALVTAVATGPAAAAPAPIEPPPSAGWTKVDASLFGMHVGNVERTEFERPIGGIRLWDSRVRWDEIAKANGEYDFTRLDRAVAAAEAAGAEEIVYVLGSTPQWAAKHVRPDLYYYGGGTASEPRKMSYWRDWVRTVAARYQGRITAYQIWNEANLASFFAPERKAHWKRMALLTDIAADEIRAIDRRAKIVSASSTVIQSKKFAKESFFYRYLRSLAKRKVKVDVISLHLYPWTTKGPGGGTPANRLAGLKMARQVIEQLGMGKVPIWDTEVNYGNRRDNGHPEEVFSPKVGAAYLARTYIDSLRYDVEEVFWYSWDSHVMGISTIDPATREPLAPGTAFYTVQEWLAGARWGGCSEQRVTVCAIKRKGQRQYLLFADLGRSRTVKVPRAKFDVSQVCTLNGDCQRIRKRTVRVKQAPVLLAQ